MYPNKITVEQRKEIDLQLLERLHSLGIYTVEDLLKRDLSLKAEIPLPVWDELP